MPHLIPHGRPQDADLIVTGYTEAQRRCARSGTLQRNDVRQDIGYRERGLIAIAPSPIAPFNPMTYAPTFGSFGSYPFFIRLSPSYKNFIVTLRMVTFFNIMIMCVGFALSGNLWAQSRLSVLCPYFILNGKEARDER